MKWLYNAWYAAMYSAELKSEQVETRTVLNETMVIFRDGQGVVSALEDRCPHRNAPLSAGKVLAEGTLKCGYHGLEFNGSGECTHNPHGKGSIPKACRVRSYPLHEKYGLIWVWMGTEPADTTKIPDYSVYESGSEYLLGKPDWIRMNVPWYLVIDNLLDLSHVSFLHDGLLGNADTIKADTVVTQEGEAVIVERLTPNIEAPEYFAIISQVHDARVDMWQNIRWTAPSCTLLDVGCVRAGEPKEKGTGTLAAHILTPETESSTLYHFMSARYNPVLGSDSPEALKRLAELRRMAFVGQDEPMMQAQYKIIQKQGGEIRPVLLEVDAGVVRWRRIMDEKLETESSKKEGAVSTA